ncbi:MAG: fumarate hydratase, partial [Thermoplasmata archaeon]
MVTEADIANATVDLLRKAVVKLPPDVEKAIRRAYAAETDEVPKMQLKAIVDNIDLAIKGNTPMCQDTGVTIFYVTLPKECKVNVEKGIVEGVKRAPKEVTLRPNAVHPCTRTN